MINLVIGSAIGSVSGPRAGGERGRKGVRGAGLGRLRGRVLEQVPEPPIRPAGRNSGGAGMVEIEKGVLRWFAHMPKLPGASAHPPSLGRHRRGNPREGA